MIMCPVTRGFYIFLWVYPINFAETNESFAHIARLKRLVSDQIITKLLENIRGK